MITTINDIMNISNKYGINNEYNISAIMLGLGM